MTDFLQALGDQIDSQFYTGENKNNSLNIVNGESTERYGKLGDFSKQFDHTEERRYLEEGYLRQDSYRTEPKTTQINWQEPSGTILVKKKMFSSLAENHRKDFMDSDEKLFFRASQFLFKNKCIQIGAYERLCKIQRASSDVGKLNDQMMPIIIGLSDAITNPTYDLNGNLQFEEGVSQSFQTFYKSVSKVRTIFNYSNPAKYTTWLSDLQNQLGVGVIELTEFTSLNTTVSCKRLGAGNASFNVVDPYKYTRITQFDIEKAINDALNNNYDKNIVVLGSKAAESTFANQLFRLNELRRRRGANKIIVERNLKAIFDNRVTAYVDRVGIEIKFEYQSAAGFGGIGAALEIPNIGSITLSEEFYLGGGILGSDGLANNELSLFREVISSAYNLNQLEYNAGASEFANNKFTNYARKKLSFYFLGKSIIQAMDVVHIYLNSKTKRDMSIFSGTRDLFNGLGFLQNLDNTLFDLNKSWDILFNPSSNVSIQTEKSVFVGDDFPNNLWSRVRDSFVNDKDGTHIFGGLVTSANMSYSDGSNTLAVSCADNAHYFTQGQVNMKPAVDAFFGTLLDPLTPFVTKFDQVSTNARDMSPELLPENKALLAGNNKTPSVIRYKSGPNAGRRVEVSGLINDKVYYPDNTNSRILYGPDGLVYKWKEGIGVLTQYGNSYGLNDPGRVGPVNILNDPFGGQDVMNVISLCITGQPYNFITFYRNVQNFDGAVKDPQTGESSASSFFSYLQNELLKRNAVWGNFIPFKNLVIDEESYKQLLNSYASINTINDKITSSLRKIEDLYTKLAMSNQVYTTGTPPPEGSASPLQAQISQLYSSIETYGKEVSSELSKNKNSLTINGDDVSYDTDSLQNTKDGLTNPEVRRELRRRVNFLTRRMSWQVRANEDKNLFIVDDLYDKDYDLIAFDKQLSNNIGLLSNNYTSVQDKISIASSVLQLEVFCDTQGHIRVRPPQYNRMPSSIFYKMLKNKKEKGVQVFPQFIEDMFSDQLKTMVDKVSIVEDEIRLLTTVLGASTDLDSANIVNQSKGGGGRGSVAKSAIFAFISKSDGSILDLRSVITESNPDTSIQNQKNNTLKTVTDLVSEQAKTKGNIFSVSDRAKFVKDWSQQTKEPDFAGDIMSSDRLNIIVNRLQRKTGQRIVLDNYLSSNYNANGVTFELGSSSGLNIFKITSDLAEKISQRFRLLKVLNSLLRNYQEAKSLETDNSLGNKMMFPNLYGIKGIPEMFEHLIENESYDDLGPGSGSRYIIRNEQIISFNLNEQPPDYSYIEVVGQLDPITNASVPALNGAFLQGGNGLVTAAAVDYDLWRMYGFKTASQIKLPFFSDANSQCAPYAAMLLARARRDILKCNMTIVGNEYMQPGEVVYIEELGLLFYVDTVSHSFSWGSFTTTLSLSYGGIPGDYIPIPLDVIGKILYNNKDVSGITNYRQDNAFNANPLGALMLNPQKPTSDKESSKSEDKISKANSSIINNIIFNSAYLVNLNSSKDNNVSINIELRVFYNSKSFSGNTSADTELVRFANDIKSILTNPDGGSVYSGGTMLSKPSKIGLPGKNEKTKEDLIKVVTIDLGDEKEKRSPSQKAWDSARDIVDQYNPQLSSSFFKQNLVSKPEFNEKYESKSTGVFEDTDKTKLCMYKYIVDCWASVITTVPEPSSKEGSSTKDSTAETPTQNLTIPGKS